MSRRIAIWDIDNCLADDGWRIPFIAWQHANPDMRYAPYHLRCAEDARGNLELFRAVSQTLEPVFCTARPEAVYHVTRSWLRRNLGLRDPLLVMRKNEEHLPSKVLKLQMLSMLRGSGFTVCAAFDDREDVVQMYRDAGVAAARLWIHDRCAMTPPEIHAERIES